MAHDNQICSFYRACIVYTEGQFEGKKQKGGELLLSLLIFTIYFSLGFFFEFSYIRGCLEWALNCLYYLHCSSPGPACNDKHHHDFSMGIKRRKVEK